MTLETDHRFTDLVRFIDGKFEDNELDELVCCLLKTRRFRTNVLSAVNATGIWENMRELQTAHSNQMALHTWTALQTACSVLHRPHHAGLSADALQKVTGLSKHYFSKSVTDFCRETKQIDRTNMRNKFRPLVRPWSERTMLPSPHVGRSDGDNKVYAWNKRATGAWECEKILYRVTDKNMVEIWRDFLRAHNLTQGLLGLLGLLGY